MTDYFNMMMESAEKYLLFPVRSYGGLETKYFMQTDAISMLNMFMTVSLPAGNMTGVAYTGEATLEDHANLKPTLQSGSGEL